MDPTHPAPRRQKVVIIEDELALGKALATLLTRAHFDVTHYGDPVEGMGAAAESDVDVVLLDINLPHVSGLDILRDLKAKRPDIEVIMMTGQASVPSVLSAVKIGAYDYLTKPFENIEMVANTVRRAADRKALKDRNRELERLVETSQISTDFIGESAKMRAVFQLIEEVSYSTSTVLIQGESGTGKELVARSIHKRSPRKSQPFVAINCAAMTETLLESELFGHVKGAFTGAASNKKGLFEAANGGTLFLDEIGDMPLMTQVRLLRVLQEGEVRPVGANETIKVDVRLIAASNVDLKKAMTAGKFREDLFYRLNVITVALPPLRERPTDVPVLAHHFLRLYSRKLNKSIEKIAGDALEALVGNKWPGNVRELENVMERATVLARGKEITLMDLPPGFTANLGAHETDIGSLSHLPYSQAKKLAQAAFDRRYLQGMLKKARGNITSAATLAGLDRSNFRRLLKHYGLQSAGKEDDKVKGPAASPPSMPIDDGSGMPPDLDGDLTDEREVSN
ncbi:MAG: sigma-54 dependent transcriptional regulator [Myxococcaceae bacterium]|nr:sigma-54 dependent transcriptional regulator [Myxococcaceae bacterium]